MKVMIKIMLLTVFIMLQGCASNPSTPETEQGFPTRSYSPATTNSSYIFRSPPPGFVGGAMHNGR